MNETSKSLKKSIINGLFWKFSERFLAQGVSFFVSVCLARILTPSDFGIVAIVLVFISLANVFVTSGFSTALVQNKKANQVDFSTNFYCSFALALILYFVMFYLSPIIADFYDNDLLCPVLRIFSFKIPLSAFSSIQHAYVERNMIFKKYFFSTLFGTIISGIVGVYLAYQGYGVWSLVWQYLTNTIVDIIVLFFTIPWRPTLDFSFNSAKTMMNYGWKVLAADFTGTFFEQLRSILIGKVYTSADLAYYNKGNQLPSLITCNVSSSIMTVLFPAMANINDDIKKIKVLTRKSVNIMSFIMFPLLFGLAAIAKPLIIFLFTEKWIMSVPYVRILSIAYGISLIGSVSLQAIKAIGRSDILLKLEFVKKPVYLILLVIGLKINVLYVAITMGLYNLYGTVVNCFALKYNINYEYREQINDIFSSLMISTLMFFIVVSLENLPLNCFYILLIQILAGIVVYIVIACLIKHPVMIYVKDKLNRKG